MRREYMTLRQKQRKKAEEQDGEEEEGGEDRAERRGRHAGATETLFFCMFVCFFF